MQVYFLGADTTINYQPSSTWLAEQARFWPWRSHLLMNAPRSEALSVLSMEGMMVVFCSLVENMPYVVAEVLLLPVTRPLANCRMHGPKGLGQGCLWPQNCEDAAELVLPLQCSRCFIHSYAWMTCALPEGAASGIMERDAENCKRSYR